MSVGALSASDLLALMNQMVATISADLPSYPGKSLNPRASWRFYYAAGSSGHRDSETVTRENMSDTDPYQADEHLIARPLIGA